MSVWLLALMLMRQGPDTVLGCIADGYGVCVVSAQSKAQSKGITTFIPPHIEDDYRELSHWVEQHCVAVLREAHDEQGSMDCGPIPAKDQHYCGDKWTEHIPEQTLKLRCKP